MLCTSGFTDDVIWGVWRQRRCDAGRSLVPMNALFVYALRTMRSTSLLSIITYQTLTGVNKLKKFIHSHANGKIFQEQRLKIWQESSEEPLDNNALCAVGSSLLLHPVVFSVSLPESSFLWLHLCVQSSYYFSIPHIFIQPLPVSKFIFFTENSIL